MRETELIPADAATLDDIETRVVTARHPGDVWHIDLTTVPTGPSFWVPWFPFALPPSWPFCWWVAVVVGHFSRAVVGFALFRDRPTSGDIQRCLGQAIRNSGCSPEYVITDKSDPRRTDPVGSLRRSSASEYQILHLKAIDPIGSPRDLGLVG